MFQNIFKTKSDIIANPLSPNGERIADQKSRAKYIRQLKPSMQYLAESFYAKLDALLPQNFHLRLDTRAPRREEPNSGGKNGMSTSLSMELAMDRESMCYKYGTGRVALRKNLFFAKTVTWMTPKTFLHQRAVYDLIKQFYQDCEVVPNRSKTHNGFTVKNKKHIITLEVFGDNPKRGYLACDITLNGSNQQLARDRLQHFVDFYADLYNILENEDLHFKASNPQAEMLASMEFIGAAKSDKKNEPKWLG